MWTSELRNVIVIFVSSAVLFAATDIIQAKAQNRSGAEARQIMKASIAANQCDWEARLHDTYMERAENRHLDAVGHVKSEDVDVSRMILVNGVSFTELVEHNGRSPSAGEKRTQKA